LTGRLLTIAILLGIAVLGVRAWPWGIPWTGGPAARSDPGDNVPGAAIHDLTVRLGTAKEVRPTGQVREFSLIAKKATWELAPGRTVLAITYDGTVPGPTIRVTEGDTVRVMLKNDLDQETTIHFHGLHVPNGMDGVPPFTQAPIKPGETFTYEFVGSHAGTFMYHPHINSVEQIDNGLYGLFIIDPQRPDEPKFDRDFSMMLGAWILPAGETAPPGGEHQMPGGKMMPGVGMGGMNMNYNWFTINGKAFPATAEWVVKKGDIVRVRLVNISNLAHPMHLHGHDFKVIAKDGEPIRPELQQVMNTLTVNPGETYDIAFVADNPGVWVFHCHELHHTENDGVEPGGLIQVIRYQGAPASPAQPQATPTMPARMPGMRH
jgi:FtsP/CotA-like multicopper oxidase with cupredoxin domain